MEDTLRELTEKIEIIETREIALEKKYNREKSKATYYKDESEKINEKLKKFRNLNCEKRFRNLKASNVRYIKNKMCTTFKPAQQLGS